MTDAAHVVVSIVAIAAATILTWHGPMSGSQALAVIGLALGSHVAAASARAFGRRRL